MHFSSVRPQQHRDVFLLLFAIRFVHLGSANIMNISLGLFLSLFVFQIMSMSEGYVPEGGLLCVASTDSILDYRQFLILSIGNFLCSAATANSTMDFSTKPIDDSIVDSPPSGSRHLPISCSLSPLQPPRRPTLPLDFDKGPQRKLYVEDQGPAISIEMRSDVPSVLGEDRQYSVPVQQHQRSSSQRKQLKRSQGLYGGKANATMSDEILKPLPKRRVLSVARLLNRLVPETSIQDICRSWNAANEKSLKMQRREFSLQQSGGSCRYSRGPEILKAFEKLKSKSHSWCV